MKYDGYIKRQIQQVEKFKKFEERSIPESFNYESVKGFSREVLEKFKRVRPFYSRSGLPYFRDHSRRHFPFVDCFGTI
ncbi:MAG: hypothetical protein KatS3mg082_2296 [Nitrospiraceae bacterium]|nr:MAG: hypothetical protein KatS3mg082_2296 [Nitrospiraceae bacterium]